MESGTPRNFWLSADYVVSIDNLITSLFHYWRSDLLYFLLYSLVVDFAALLVALLSVTLLNFLFNRVFNIVLVHLIWEHLLIVLLVSVLKIPQSWTENAVFIEVVLRMSSRILKELVLACNGTVDLFEPSNCWGDCARHLLLLLNLFLIHIVQSLLEGVFAWLLNFLVKILFLHLLLPFWQLLKIPCALGVVAQEICLLLLQSYFWGDYCWLCWISLLNLVQINLGLLSWLDQFSALVKKLVEWWQLIACLFLLRNWSQFRLLQLLIKQLFFQRLSFICWHHLYHLLLLVQLLVSVH